MTLPGVNPEATWPDSITTFQGPILRVLPADPADAAGKRAVLTGLGLVEVPANRAEVGRIVTITRRNAYAEVSV